MADGGRPANAGKARACRWWIGTAFEELDDKRRSDWIDQELISAYAGQLEECPSTQRRHLQFCVRFKQPRTFAWVRDQLGCHVEPSIDPKAAWLYCQKTDTRVEGPWVFGEPDRRTRKEERDIVIAMVRVHTHVADVAEQLNASVYSIPTLARAMGLLRRPFYGEPKLEYRYGETGAGKTTGAMTKEGDKFEQIFLYSVTENVHAATEYDGERVILFEEFDKWPTYPGSYLLPLLDRGKKSIRYVGGTRTSSADTYYFCSNLPPWELPMTRSTKIAFLRRLSQRGSVIRLNADHSETVIPLSSEPPFYPTTEGVSVAAFYGETLCSDSAASSYPAHPSPAMGDDDSPAPRSGAVP